MTRRTVELTEALHAYVLANSLREHDAQRRLREATARLPEADMQSSPEQIQLLGLLLELMPARRVLEVGCFTGYGALGFALTLPADGQVVTLDFDERFPSIGRPFWEQAGVEGRIELRTGHALDSLDRLLAEGEAGHFDFVYIDADKKHYDSYYERALLLVRPGGLIALDNVLWHGTVADPKNTDHQTESLRALNAKIHQDARVTMSLLAIADGLTLARRR